MWLLCFKSTITCVLTSTHYHQYCQVPMCEYVCGLSWVMIVIQYPQNQTGLFPNHHSHVGDLKIWIQNSPSSFFSRLLLLPLFFSFLSLVSFSSLSLIPRLCEPLRFIVLRVFANRCVLRVFTHFTMVVLERWNMDLSGVCPKFVTVFEHEPNSLVSPKVQRRRSAWYYNCVILQQLVKSVRS